MTTGRINQVPTIIIGVVPHQYSRVVVVGCGCWLLYQHPPTIIITTILCCKRLFDLGVCVCVVYTHTHIPTSTHTLLRDFITLVLVAHTYIYIYIIYMACVSSLSNKLQMPRQHKELWAVCKEREKE